MHKWSQMVLCCWVNCLGAIKAQCSIFLKKHEEYDSHMLGSPAAHGEKTVSFFHLFAELSTLCRYFVDILAPLKCRTFICCITEPKGFDSHFESEADLCIRQFPHQVLPLPNTSQASEELPDWNMRLTSQYNPKTISMKNLRSLLLWDEMREVSPKPLSTGTYSVPLLFSRISILCPKDECILKSR